MIKHALSRNLDMVNSVLYVPGCDLYCLCIKNSKIIKQCYYLGTEIKINENMVEKINCKRKSEKPRC